LVIVAGLLGWLFQGYCMSRATQIAHGDATAMPRPGDIRSHARRAAHVFVVGIIPGIAGVAAYFLMWAALSGITGLAGTAGIPTEPFASSDVATAIGGMVSMLPAIAIWSLVPVALLSRVACTDSIIGTTEYRTALGRVWEHRRAALVVTLPFAAWSLVRWPLTAWDRLAEVSWLAPLRATDFAALVSGTAQSGLVFHVAIQCLLAVVWACTLLLTADLVGQFGRVAWCATSGENVQLTQPAFPADGAAR
ncbi:MAG: DUF4013 domain-containing protein, partial [Actinobacteria bacterium]